MTHTTQPEAGGHTPDGMSLRDWFAGQALTSVLAQASNLGAMAPEKRQEAWQFIAETLYELADAMLAARAKVQS